MRRGSRSAKESVRQFVALREFEKEGFEEGGGGTGLLLLCVYIMGVLLDTDDEPKGSEE